MRHNTFLCTASPCRKARAVLFVLAFLVFSVLSVFFFYLLPNRQVPILMYHSISTATGSSMCVSPGVFARQMKFLKDNGYRVISLEDLTHMIKSGTRYAPRTVVITFDDGFKDNFTEAFPVLAKYDMPATIFVITGYLDKEDGYLSYDQVLIMSKNGIDIGAHTRDNVYLPAIKDREVLWKEIRGPKEDLEARTGIAVKFFCYPTGGHNDTVKEMVRLAGYFGACTTNRGFNRANDDIFALKRIKATNSDTEKFFHFQAKLSGFYNLFKKEKSPE